MSAIAAVLERDGGPAEVARVDAMLALLPPARAGLARATGAPEADRVASARFGPVALGVAQRFATPEDALGDLPAELGGGRFAIAADVRLVNRDDIAQRLGEPAPERSDTQLVVAAYARWGDRCLALLDGDFAFAVWDRERGELLCARSPLGVRPLYYAFDGQRFACASSESALLAPLGRRPEVCREALAELICEVYADAGATLHRGIFALPPGHALSATRRHVHLRPFWRPDPARREALESDAAYAERFAAVFAEAVRARSRAGTRLGVLVSGGLDSPSVAVELDTQRRAASAGASALLFHAAFPGRACDESHLARALAQRLDTELVAVAPDPRGVGPEAFGRDPADRWAPDVLFQPTMQMFGPLFEAARSRGVRVLLTGLGGDLLLRPTGLEIADALRAADLPTAWRATGRRLGVSLPVAFVRAARSSLPLWAPARWRARWWRHKPAVGAAGMLTGPVRRALVERMVQSALPAAPSRAADLATAALCTDLVGWDGTQAQSQWTKLAAAAGLELWHPFLDRRLVETLLSFPPIQRMAYDRAIAKPVLRRAMAARLPAIIAARTDFTEFSAFVAQAIFDPTPERVRALLGDGLLVSSGVVRRDAIRALLSVPSRADVRAVTELVAAELWLRRV